MLIFILWVMPSDFSNSSNLLFCVFYWFALYNKFLFAHNISIKETTKKSSKFMYRIAVLFILSQFHSILLKIIFWIVRANKLIAIEWKREKKKTTMHPRYVFPFFVTFNYLLSLSFEFSMMINYIWYQINELIANHLNKWREKNREVECE